MNNYYQALDVKMWNSFLMDHTNLTINVRFNLDRF